MCLIWDWVTVILPHSLGVCQKRKSQPANDLIQLRSLYQLLYCFPLQLPATRVASPLETGDEVVWNQWLRLWKQVRRQEQARLLLLGERPLYPPPVSHWSHASVSSKHVLIGWRCLRHQPLGSREGLVCPSCRSCLRGCTPPPTIIGKQSQHCQ